MTFVRILLIICLVVAISSCEKNKNTNLKSETFFTEDSLFRIELDVPLELDSFYTWIDYNDTSCGHRRKYRFSDSRYPIFKESGFFYLSYPDSTYRLTFSHIDKYDCQDTVWEIDLNRLIAGWECRSKIDSIEFNVISSERTEINGLTFSILTFITDAVPKGKYQSTLLWGFTKINGIDLKVECECASKDCDSFIGKMNETLKSIRITKKD